MAGRDAKDLDRGSCSFVCASALSQATVRWQDSRRVLWIARRPASAFGSKHAAARAQKSDATTTANGSELKREGH